MKISGMCRQLRRFHQRVAAECHGVPRQCSNLMRIHALEFCFGSVRFMIRSGSYEEKPARQREFMTSSLSITCMVKGTLASESSPGADPGCLQTRRSPDRHVLCLPLQLVGADPLPSSISFSMENSSSRPLPPLLPIFVGSCFLVAANRESAEQRYGIQ